MSDPLIPTRFYCVIDIRSGDVLYLGHSSNGAAQRLRPGTCYAKHPLRETAANLAVLQRDCFVKDGYCD